MKRMLATFAALALAFSIAGAAHAGKDDLDITRLNNSLDQLANDPVLGAYAQAEQARARDAINQLAQASRSDRAHDLYIAERRVDLARTAAQLQDAQHKLSQLAREHDQILLANSQAEANRARVELERQRLQYQLAQEETARLQQQGEEAAATAAQALAQAEQAKKLAAAQSKVAAAARREAALAAKAARAMRAQMQSGDNPEPAPAKPKKAPRKDHEQH